MKKRSLFGMLAIAALILTACSGASTPLKDLAETYAQIADNNQEMTEAFQAVYKASGAEQQALQKKAVSIAQSVSEKNASLAETAASLAEKLQGQEIECEASAALGIKPLRATFTTINTNDKMATIVITVEIEGTPGDTPFFFLMDDKEVLYKSAAKYSPSNITASFHITTGKGSAKALAIAKTQSLKLVTRPEFDARVLSDTK